MTTDRPASAGRPATEDERGRPALAAGARVALIVNPASRQGRDRETVDVAARALASRFVVDVFAPASADAVEAGVREAARSHDAVVIVGGDGTINRAAGALAGSACPVGIVPAGTGNDFARGCGIPARPDAAARRILDGIPRPIDLARVNGRVYCTVGVFGLAADSALAVGRLATAGPMGAAIMRGLGDWSYRAAGAWCMIQPRGLTTAAAIHGPSGETLFPEADVHEVFVANTAMLGGGLVVPVGADASDGLLDLAVVPRLSRPRLMRAFASFATGRPLPPGTLRVRRAPRAVITTARPVRFSADGDLMCEGNRFDLEALPGALLLIR